MRYKITADSTCDLGRDLIERYDIGIHVNISSDFSCSHQNAKLAAADLPNVYVVDSRNLSTGHGHIVLEAARMAAEGMGPEEIVQQLEALTARVDASFILEQLEYMKKSGRCSAVALLGANLLKLRPCIEVKDGKASVVASDCADKVSFGNGVCLPHRMTLRIVSDDWETDL